MDDLAVCRSTGPAVTYHLQGGSAICQTAPDAPRLEYRQTEWTMPLPSGNVLCLAIRETPAEPPRETGTPASEGSTNAPPSRSMEMELLLLSPETYRTSLAKYAASASSSTTP